MSVVVLGMDMPTGNWACPLLDEYGFCSARVKSGGAAYCSKDVREKRVDFPDWCPLRPLPEKHGRLIDADKLEGAGYALSKLRIDNDAQNTKQMIWRELIPFDEAPTIIEAEGGSVYDG